MAGSQRVGDWRWRQRPLDKRKEEQRLAAAAQTRSWGSSTDEAGGERTDSLNEERAAAGAGARGSENRGRVWERESRDARHWRGWEANDQMQSTPENGRRGRLRTWTSKRQTTQSHSPKAQKKAPHLAGPLCPTRDRTKDRNGLKTGPRPGPYWHGPVDPARSRVWFNFGPTNVHP